MGCFNVACGISGGTIREGERTGMVLIEPRQYNHVDKQFRMFSDLFVPVAPPIYGEYDDYGSLINIEHSPVVDYVETEFGMPVELLLQCLTVEEPFSLLNDEIPEFFYPKDSILVREPFASVSDKNLEELGFVKKEKVLNSVTWEYEDWEIVQTFDFYSVTTVKERSFPFLKDVCFYVSSQNLNDFVREFHKVTNRWVGTTIPMSDTFNKVKDLSWMPFIPEVFDRVVECSDFMNIRENAFDRLLKELSDAFDSFSMDDGDFRLPLEYSLCMPDIHDVLNISSNGYRYIVDHPDSWRPIFQMADVMKSVNKIYMPYVLGKQSGDYMAEKAVGEILLERANDRIKELEE